MEKGPRLNRSDYERMQTPQVVDIDSETVRIYCPKSDKYISIEFEMPDIASRDAFLESKKSWRHFLDLGGQVVFEPPHHVLEEQMRKARERLLRPTTDNEQDIGTTDAETLAQELGITADELKEAYKAAITHYFYVPD